MLKKDAGITCVSPLSGLYFNNSLVKNSREVVRQILTANEYVSNPNKWV